MFTMDSRHGMKTSLVSLIITVIITLTLSAAAKNDYHHSEKMLLSDVKALTLRSGSKTNARRSSAVPQLKCVGGAAEHKFKPKVVQCLNMGSDGYDIQWECKTDMDNAYRFGHVEVTCEGYDYPNDPYILKGSCGLEYTLEFTEEGVQREKQKSGYSHSYSYEKSSEGGVGGLFVFVGILVAIYIVYKVFLSPDKVTADGRPTEPPPYGFRPEFSQPPSGSPPPYPGTQDSGYAGSSPFSSSYSHRTNTHRSPNDGPGFWSGAATGGVLGYMFGSRNSNSPGYTSMPRNDGFFSSSSTSRSRSSSPMAGSSSSSGTRTASGFGGTSRR